MQFQLVDSTDSHMIVWSHDTCTDVQAVHACVHTVLAVTAVPAKMHKSKILMAVSEA